MTYLELTSGDHDFKISNAFVIIGSVSSYKTIIPTTWKFTLIFTSAKNSKTAYFVVLQLASKRRSDGA